MAIMLIHSKQQWIGVDSILIPFLLELFSFPRRKMPLGQADGQLIKSSLASNVMVSSPSNVMVSSDLWKSKVYKGANGQQTSNDANPHEVRIELVGPALTILNGVVHGRCKH